MILTTAEYWVILGLVLIIIDLTMFPGFGIICAGIGGISIGTLLIYFPFYYPYQYLIFMIVSSLSALIFYTFIRRLPRTVRVTFNDIHGYRVQVISDVLEYKKIGQVRYSGTVMNARMLHANEMAQFDEFVFVHLVQGNILLCSKNQTISTSLKNDDIKAS